MSVLLKWLSHELQSWDLVIAIWYTGFRSYCSMGLCLFNTRILGLCLFNTRILGLCCFQHTYLDIFMNSLESSLHNSSTMGHSFSRMASFGMLCPLNCVFLFCLFVLFISFYPFLRAIELVVRICEAMEKYFFFFIWMLQETFQNILTYFLGMLPSIEYNFLL